MDEEKAKDNKSFMAIMVVLAIAIGVVAVAISNTLHPRPTAVGSKVTVLRAIDFIRQAAGDRQPTSDDVNKGLIQMKKRAKELAAQGWIVLDERAVLEAPAHTKQ